MTDPAVKIDPNGDAHLNAGLALGRLIHQALTEIHDRLDRIEAKIAQQGTDITQPGGTES